MFSRLPYNGVTWCVRYVHCAATTRPYLASHQKVIMVIMSAIDMCFSMQGLKWVSSWTPAWLTALCGLVNIIIDLLLLGHARPRPPSKTRIWFSHIKFPRWTTLVNVAAFKSVPFAYPLESCSRGHLSWTSVRGRSVSSVWCGPMRWLNGGWSGRHGDH